MIHVLFVCLGNICRSPMGEAIFRDILNKEELTDKISVDSAGTLGVHKGKSPHEGTRKILDENDISYKDMIGRQITQKDFETFDYIIVMDEQNMLDLVRTYDVDDSTVIKKLLDFVLDSDEVDVPDPYYTGDFDYSYKLIVNGCKSLLTYIKHQHNI